MAEDPRCCGSGTCIIDSEGHCWCGQQWDGEKMAAPAPALGPGIAGPGGSLPAAIDPDTAAHP